MRRNQLDIVADIIKVANKGSSKTGLVYKANLNFKIVKRYINRMIDNGLLEKRGDLFFSTQKGDIFLENYKSTMNLFSETPRMEVF
jgi:predicted transcriptional regulator